MARITARDFTGAFIWDSELHAEPPVAKMRPHLKDLVEDEEEDNRVIEEYKRDVFKSRGEVLPVQGSWDYEKAQNKSQTLPASPKKSDRSHLDKESPKSARSTSESPREGREKKNIDKNKEKKKTHRKQSTHSKAVASVRQKKPYYGEFIMSGLHEGTE